jgi:hypothetical protein
MFEVCQRKTSPRCQKIKKEVYLFFYLMTYGRMFAEGKTKDYSKFQYMLEILLRLWNYYKDIFNNINKFVRFKTEM